MKKAIVTIGLFSMMMVLTSFSTSSVKTLVDSSVGTSNYDTGGHGSTIDPGKKLDYDLINHTVIEVSHNRGASIGAGKKMD